MRFLFRRLLWKFVLNEIKLFPKVIALSLRFSVVATYLLFRSFFHILTLFFLILIVFLKRLQYLNNLLLPHETFISWLQHEAFYIVLVRLHRHLLVH